ncbi:hypothetical protein [Microbacterium sp.]|uniref:hypothetical protein n=1 Tax=Microbacterium sp. TaxID=51671 RepID=UPI003C716C99
MVAHVLRLRLDLIFGALRGDRRRVIRAAISLVLLILIVALACVGILSLRAVPSDVAYAVTIVGCSALTLGFVVAALVGGADDQLDPRRFAVFGATAHATAWTTLLASIVSMPILGACVVAVAFVTLWTAQGASSHVATLSAVIGVVTCLLFTKVAFAIASLLLRDRRSRELTGVFLIALLVVIVPVVVFLASLEWHGEVPSALTQAVDVLAMTPLGAAWALPGAALTGSLVPPLLIASVTIVALGGLWLWLVDRLLTTTERPGSARERRGLGWFDITGSTPAGGVAARSLIYWSRDPRYLVNVAIVPVAAVVAVVPLVLVGVPMSTASLLPAPLIALFLGWLVHNDIAYDSTALWMHIASAVRGVADRVGRLVPVAVIGILILAVVIPLSISLHGRWAMLPAMAGVCASLFLTGLGLSSVASVVAPYPVSRPGDSPFQQPQRTGGGLSQGVVLVAAIVLSLPSLWWAWLALTVDAEWSWLALWGGAGIGAVVLVGGVLGGGAVFDRSGGRLMEFAAST